MTFHNEDGGFCVLRLKARGQRDLISDQRAIREIMIFVHSHGVGTPRAVRIFKTYARMLS